MAIPISDEAVKTKTGKNWADWVVVLDNHGCAKMSHKEIAILVDAEYKLGGWWSQMVTVQYERALGLRDVNQNAPGFEVSVSKTMPIALEPLYTAINSWINKQHVKIRKTNVNKSVLMDWKADASDLKVYLHAKGDEKTQVVMQHAKLKKKDDVEKYRAKWKAQLAVFAEGV
jgi:hypothetical protein